MSEQAAYLEEIKDRPVDVDAVLTDDELEAGGLAPIAAYVRTKSSKNALRIQKARAKAEAGTDGTPRRQLNIVAPADDASRNALKAASDALLQGIRSPAEIMAALTGEAVQQPAPAPAEPARVIDEEALTTGLKAKTILAAGGIRAAILRRLLS